MPTPFAVDDASDSDIPTLLALFRELGGRRAEQADDVTLRSGFRRFLRDRDAHLFVARRGKTIIGAASLVIRPRLNVARPEGWIPDLVVTAAARRAGVGRALVARCAAVARERGCSHLRLESGSWRRDEAHRFYRSLGFEEIASSFRLPL